ncbi:hypothetical protein K505DRAFT_255940 [Melanomma pulvis-pyrius CBS 109.77]|uniref:Uncharacterized protein n=1 Tax=Melanomma pulvis-pyrius CBS 109.77 TaxID=1314802 RepID=A0A6A6WWD3_9PLEO|nr:hypothetical protein K505DRAFT_255940 [Melanomma pulvis-pyrius CBS 109.77]
MDHHDEDIDEKTLSALLLRKLGGMPNNHLPVLTLADIVNQTPKATHFPHIPADLQLAYFLANRAAINRCRNRYHVLAIKDAAEQSLTLTRAIFFYRLDPLHQFARYHDSARWNTAIFVALVSAPTSTNPYTAYHLPPAGRRFGLAYLNAVIETHNEPSVFTRREAFVQLWKESAYDFFHVERPSQQKFLRNQMRRLKRAWEQELDEARRQMGSGRYARRVGPLVGALFPGRADQATGVSIAAPQVGPPGVDGGGSAKWRGPVEKDRNELLRALRVPLEDETGQGFIEDHRARMMEYSTVVSIPAALDAVKNSSPRDMLTTLLALY